jgi:hypothetical protein
VSEWHIRQGSQERLVWSWYSIGGVAVASEYKAKALTAWAMLTGKGDHSVVTVMDTRLRSTQELSSTRSDAQSFDRARDRLIAVAAQANQVIAR